MPKPIPTREIARRCLRRIQRWQSVPQFAGQERDWTFFTSAFPEYRMTSQEIYRGLAVLESAGFIRLVYPRPARNPDCFIVEYVAEVAA